MTLIKQQVSPMWPRLSTVYQGALMDEQGDPGAWPEGEIAEGEFDSEIIVANDLTPADTIELNKHSVRAFITNLGSPISHTAILARSLKIPAIVGLHGGIRFLRTGDLLIIDGKRGVVLANPDEATLEAYRIRRKKILRRFQELEALVEESASSLDGVEVALNSNIELPEEILESESLNAAGVRLVSNRVPVYESCRDSGRGRTIREIQSTPEPNLSSGHISELWILAGTNRSMGSVANNIITNLLWGVVGSDYVCTIWPCSNRSCGQFTGQRSTAGSNCWCQCYPISKTRSVVFFTARGA